MRTSNPALKENSFRAQRGVSDDPMTMNGTVSKSFLSLLLLGLSAGFAWSHVSPTIGPEGMTLAGNPGPFLLVGGLGGFIVSLITIFKPTTAPFTAPLYAVLEGLAVGAISSLFEVRYPGLVIQSVIGTFGTLASLLLAYRTGLVRATEGFKRGVVAATGGIAILYLVSMVMSLFGMPLSFMHDSSPLSIGLSVVVVSVAAFNLILDFDFIENAARAGAPKYMEWYGAFGLTVTLVWLYLEILRLLSKLRDRR